MAVTTVTSGLNQVKGIKYTVIADSSTDWPSVGNNVYFYDKATSLPYYKNAGGTVVSIFEEGGVSSNVYTADGTLVGDRTVNLNNNDLNFKDGNLSSTLTSYIGTSNPQGKFFEIPTNRAGYLDGSLWFRNLNNSTGAITAHHRFYSGGLPSYVGASGQQFSFGKTNNNSGAKFEMLAQYSGMFIHNNAPVTKSFLGLLHLYPDTGAGTVALNVENPVGSIIMARGNANREVILRGTNVLGTEKISLQGETLISEKLELSTTTDGFLMPRLTTAQKNAISSPDTNLMVFDTDLSSLQRYNSSAWVDVSDSIYNANGTLTGNRTVVFGNTNDLIFENSGSSSNFKINTDGDSYSLFNRSGGLKVRPASAGNDPIVVTNETETLDTFTVKKNGGGSWSAYNGVKIGELTTNDFAQFTIDDLNFYKANVLQHKIGFGANTSDIDFWLNGASANNSFRVGGSNLIDVETISLKGKTIIQGEGTTTGTTLALYDNAATPIKKFGFLDSGKLEMTTTTDGFLMPRLTTAQKNAISTPDTNLMVFDTTLSSLQRYNSSAWVDVAVASDSIYTANGTLTGNRTVDLDANNLIFDTGVNGTVSVGGNSNTSQNLFELNGATNAFGTGAVTVGPYGNVEVKGTNSAGNFKVLTMLGNEQFTLDGNGNNSTLRTKAFDIGTSATTGYKMSFDAGKHQFIRLGIVGAYFDLVNSSVQFWEAGMTSRKFIVGGSTLIGTEKISLQDDTLITKKLELSTTTDGFLMPRLTTAQMNAISTPDTDLIIFNTDLDCVMRYDGTAWTTFDTPKYILKTAGACTPYNNLYTAINDAVNGSVIDVNISETVDCAGLVTWTWSNNITINFNGHHTIFNNLGRILLAANVSLGINNGTFELVSNSINTAAIMFSGGNTVRGDGAINVFQNTGGSTRGSFAHQTGTISNYISGVIMKGSHTFCVRGGTARIYVDNCILYTDLSTNFDALYNDNIEISNSTIYGKAFNLSGTYTIPSRETVRIINNCTIISDGESAIGSRSAIFNGCTITTNDDEIRIGIGGEQEYYNCKLERTGTVGYAFVITNTSNVRMYNTQIISSGGGVSTNLPMEFYECYIKANGGAGIVNTSGAGMIIRGGIIDSTVGSSILFNTANVAGIAKISNVTLICNTTGKHCLDVISNTTLTFSNLSMKNTATSTDIYSRAGILSENLQIETTDAFGNIILK